MKLLIGLLCLILSGCVSVPKLDMPLVDGRVYPYWYECEFGALYRLDDARLLMKDSNDQVIACTTVKMTKYQFERLRADKMRYWR